MHIWNHLTRVWPLSALLLRRPIALVGIQNTKRWISIIYVSLSLYLSPKGEFHASDDHGQRFIELLVKFDNHSNKQWQQRNETKRCEKLRGDDDNGIKPNQIESYQTKRECVNMHTAQCHASNIDYHRSKETNWWLQMTHGTTATNILLAVNVHDIFDAVYRRVHVPSMQSVCATTIFVWCCAKI